MEKLSDILSAHRDLIKTKNFDELYAYVPKDLKSVLTHTLYLHGVDPTQYFKGTVPEYFAYEGGVGDNRIPTELVLPNHILYVENNAFCSFYDLKKIAIPGVETIYDWAFQDCENLSYVGFGPKLYKISQGAFCGCYNLTELNLPASVEIIEPYAFEDCIGLKRVNYAGTMEDWSYNRVYGYAFRGCKVSTVHCTDGVTDLQI